MSFNSWLQNLRSAQAWSRCQSEHGRPGSLRAAWRRLNFEVVEDRCLLAFIAPVDYAAGFNPRDIAAADFNGDGWLDLAAVNEDYSVSTLLGNGEGAFQAARHSPGGAALIAAGDFNGDGNSDLVTMGERPTAILLATGDGTFGTPIPVAGGGRAVAVGDLNADGKADLVFTGYRAINAGEDWDAVGYVQMLLGNGDGTFADPWTDWNVGTDPASVALADLNDDGHLDVVTGEAYYGAQTVYVLLGNGDGSGRPATWYETGSTPLYLAVADLDGDGKPDLATNNGGTLAVLAGNGDGTFQAARNFLSGGGGSALADYNGDGHTDLATTNSDGSVANWFSVVHGNGDGTFAPPLRFATNDVLGGPIAADFNGDGFPDLAVTSSDRMSSARVSVLLNDANWPPPGAPSISVTGATVTEGNTGSRAATFTVSLSAAFNQTVTVGYATADGGATAGSDYQPTSGTLTFTPGETAKAIIVLVNGDRLGEPMESFFVDLSGATNAAIADGQGVGSILDDEPRISISDVSKSEGNKGTTTLFTFTVTLSAAYDQPVSMSYRTVNGTATTASADYIAKSGTLTFAPGQTTKTITIEVKGDSKREANEYFYLDLSDNSSNSSFTKKRGISTIVNDD